eukprot:gb/GECG01003785.1/.p1 GENE.gb/GECG01003785.1/~~gb/GECG01003785.1/.p1  ORF type:complete len:324 (+),score=21.90 gb/GECG01003785.1/:1-972(+)
MRCRSLTMVGTLLCSTCVLAQYFALVQYYGYTPGAMATSYTRIGDTSSKLLVMAAAVGYEKDYFQRFVRTLRKHYYGDCVLFVGNVSEDIKKLCAEHKVTLDSINLDTYTGPDGGKYKVRGGRYMAYSSACNDHYTYCFAIDFRDSFFQRDPFVNVSFSYDLVVQEERYRIGESAMNFHWLETCWGRQFALQHKTKQPVCSASIFGSPHGFRTLAEKFIVETTKSEKNPACTARDQGHLNYLLLTSKLPLEILQQPRGKGATNHLNRTPCKSVKHWASQGVVPNDDGTPSPVVHHYMRYGVLERLVNKIADIPNAPTRTKRCL